MYTWFVCVCVCLFVYVSSRLVLQASDWRNRDPRCSGPILKLAIGQIPIVTFVEPLEQVLTPRRPSHGTQKIGDVA